MGEGISQCAPWPDNSFAEMARGANWLALNRTGQNTYESYQYRYFLNDAPELIHAVDT
jgi:hypothetical protein